MPEWPVYLNGLIGIAAFILSIAVNAWLIGRYVGSVNLTLKTLREDIGELRETAKTQTQILVDMAKYRAEQELLSRRIDDVQKYGSHRLAEVLEAMRGQISSDFENRFKTLQEQLLRLGPRATEWQGP